MSRHAIQGYLTCSMPEVLRENETFPVWGMSVTVNTTLDIYYITNRFFDLQKTA